MNAKKSQQIHIIITPSLLRNDLYYLKYFDPNQAPHDESFPEGHLIQVVEISSQVPW